MNNQLSRDDTLLFDSLLDEALLLWVALSRWAIIQPTTYRLKMSMITYR